MNKKLFKSIREYKKESILAPILVILEVLMEVLIPLEMAKIIDVGIDSLIIELTGNQSKIDAFIRLLEGYEILELARTGITGLSRGAEDVRYL